MHKGHKFSYKIIFIRIIWNFTWFLLTLFLPRRSFNFLKIFILKLFKAKISYKSIVYSSAKIYMPWNLYMDDFSCIGENVNIYNVDKIIIHRNVIISQNSYLCTASHNINSINHELITKPIIINSMVWIATDVYIGPGVEINEGAVIGARACVYKNVDSWIVVGGNPSKFLRKREFLQH
jgi:putative colanic acid biosynthesis acetyltransferase WcaF